MAWNKGQPCAPGSLDSASHAAKARFFCDFISQGLVQDTRGKPSILLAFLGLEVETGIVESQTLSIPNSAALQDPLYIPQILEFQVLGGILGAGEGHLCIHWTFMGPCSAPGTVGSWGTHQEAT